MPPGASKGAGIDAAPVSREVVVQALEANALSADLHPIHLVATGERLGFWCWLTWRGRARRLNWFTPEWRGIRLHGLLDAVNETLLASVLDQWPRISAPSDLGVILNVVDHDAHQASILPLLDIGCDVWASISDRSGSRLKVWSNGHAPSLTSSFSRFVNLSPDLVGRLDTSAGRHELAAQVTACSAGGAMTHLEGISTPEQLRIIRAAGVTTFMGSVFTGDPLDDATRSSDLI